VINDKSQNSTAKHLSYNGLLYYKFITHCAGERIFKIGEHLAKLQAKWLIMSQARFALDFCPQRRRTRWITKKIVYYRQKLLLIVIMLTGRLV